MRKMLSKEYEKNPTHLTSFILKDMDRGLFLKYIAVGQEKPSEPSSPQLKFQDDESMKRPTHLRIASQQSGANTRTASEGEGGK